MLKLNAVTTLTLLFLFSFSTHAKIVKRKDLPTKKLTTTKLKNRKLSSTRQTLLLPENLPAPKMIENDLPVDPLYGHLYRASKHAETKSSLTKTYQNLCKKNPDPVLCSSLNTAIQQTENLQKQEEAGYRSAFEAATIQSANTRGIGTVQTPQQCSLDDYNPSPYDAIKVLNIRFIFPRLESDISPGGFTKDHDGIGDFTHNYIDHVNDLLGQINDITSSNAQQMNMNPVPDVLPMNLKIRMSSVTQPVIPSDKLNNYYYFSTSSGNLGSWNYPWLNPYYITSKNEINVAFQDQNGALPANLGTPLTDASGPVFGANGSWIPSIYPAFNLYASGYSAETAAVNLPFIVIESEWLRHTLWQRYWNQSTTSIDPYIGGKEYLTASLFLHELGHLLGLAHTFGGNMNKIPDYGYLMCTDLPLWKSNPWCGSGPTVQNNVMDYNCYHNALTPCQLRIIHYNMQNALKKYRYLPSMADHEYDTVIPANANATWNSPQDLVGDLVLEDNAHLTVSCGATLPVNGKIIKGVGATITNENLIIHRLHTDEATLDSSNNTIVHSLGGVDNTGNVGGNDNQNTGGNTDNIGTNNGRVGNPTPTATQKPFYQFW